MPQNFVKAIEMVEIDTSTLSAGDYTVVNEGLEKPLFLLRIINSSSNGVFISYNGSDDHDFIPANGVLQIGSQTNSQPISFVALFAARTPIYARGTASSGALYVTGYYT